MERGSDFWRFSLSLYRMDGVPPACIALQDGHGLDVNIMLFALWLGSRGRALEPAELSEADASVREWRAEAVVALRAVRRFLRTPPAAVDAAAAICAARAGQGGRARSRNASSRRRSSRCGPRRRGGVRMTRLEAGAVNIRACAQSIGAVFEEGPCDAILRAYRTLVAQGQS